MTNVNGNTFEKLLLTPYSDRDESWESAFLSACTKQKYALISDSSEIGPDGFSYLLIANDKDYFDRQQEGFIDLANWCLSKGVGLVLNPQKEYPDYIFTLGMLWYFALHGVFKKTNLHQSEKFIFLPGDSAKKVQLTNELIPDAIRNFIKMFLNQQQVVDPKILVLKQENHLDFIFSLESLGSPEDSDHKDICEALSWFLPTHYPIMILSEVGLPKFDSI
jgi:hypothetical protein